MFEYPVGRQFAGRHRPLTSISPPKAEIASTALDLLIDRIANSQDESRDVRVGHALVVRESSRRR